MRTINEEGPMGNATLDETEANKDTGPRLRVQLDFSPEAFERLKVIRANADAKTNAEVIRNALRVYEWFLKQRHEDYRLQLVKDDIVKEVELIL
jgi:hypothetical protein